MTTEFVFYVEDSEWFKLRSGELLRIRGAQITGELPPEGMRCVSNASDEVIELKTEAFRPTRPGLEGKMLSHLKRERSFVSSKKPKSEIVGMFLFPEGSFISVESFQVEILRNDLRCDGEPLKLAGNAVPVRVEGIAVNGALVFADERTGRLDLIASGMVQLEGELQLSLMNENVHHGIAFSIHLIPNSIREH